MKKGALLKKIDALSEKLNAIGGRKKWDEDFMDKVKLDFTFNSNRIEGNALI